MKREKSLSGVAACFNLNFFCRVIGDEYDIPPNTQIMTVNDVYFVQKQEPVCKKDAETVMLGNDISEQVVMNEGCSNRRV